MRQSNWQLHTRTERLHRVLDTWGGGRVGLSTRGRQSKRCTCDRCKDRRWYRCQPLMEDDFDSLLSVSALPKYLPAKTFGHTVSASLALHPSLGLGFESAYMGCCLESADKIMLFEVVFQHHFLNYRNLPVLAVHLLHQFPHQIRLWWQVIH